MPTSPLEISHKTLFKSSIRSTPSHSHSTSVPADPSGAWPSSLLSADHLEPHEWSYLAEGGKSLLLRFDGNIEAAKHGWVNHNGTKALALRLNKKRRGETSEESPDCSVPRDLFETRVASVLLESSSIVPSSTKLALPKGSQFLSKIAARIEMQRPRERRGVDGIDVNAEFIEILEDLSWSAGADVVGTEIKPKWLFSQTTSVSRYRKHQVLKNPHMDRAEFDSLYEPLDLVSGNQDSIRKAARGLAENWLKGGNNLRLFVKGKSVAADHASQVQALLQKLTSSSSSSATSKDITASLTAILTPLLASKAVQTILQRLAQLQSSLAPIDLPTLSGWYQSQTQTQGTFTPTQDQYAELLSAPQIDEFTGYAQDWLALQQQNDEGQGGEVALNLRQAIIGTLLSATVKDCSLFFRLTAKAGQAQHASSSLPALQSETVSSALEDHKAEQPDAGHQTYLSTSAETTTSAAPSDNLPFGYTVKVIDVDPKPIAKLSHWLELDQQIEKAYSEWHEGHS